MNPWPYVLSAYAVAAAVLLGYWWRVERRIRVLETQGAGPRDLRDPRAPEAPRDLRAPRAPRDR